MHIKGDINDLISSEQLADWVPGSVLADSVGKGWKGLVQRTYCYIGQDVQIPPMDCFMLVQYVSGTSPMDREFDGRWTRTECRPGHFSLLSRSMASQWNWINGLTVSHVYLDNDLMRRVAQDVTGKVANQVCLHDVLQGVDPTVSFLLHQITNEAKAESTSGQLYAEALSIQLAVHLLRNYASCDHPQSGGNSGLSQRKIRLLEEYVAAHLGEQITLQQMADVLDLGVWTFGRQVKQSLGITANVLVQGRRLDRAKDLLRGRGSTPIKEIAAICGFSDQAHMTRTFRAKMGLTPRQFRLQS